MEFTTEVVLSDDDDADFEEVRVVLAARPGRRGLRGRYGEPLTPDDEEEWEVLSVTHEGVPIAFAHLEGELIEKARAHFLSEIF